MTASSKTGYRALGGKKYELSNHLGNVLAVVTDNINLDQDSTWASVVNMTDYYPLGLAMDGRTVQDSSYRYGFNGKEQDDKGEWGSRSHYDYGFNTSVTTCISVLNTVIKVRGFLENRKEIQSGQTRHRHQIRVLCTRGGFFGWRFPGRRDVLVFWSSPVRTLGFGS